ncbi:hypothetical protein D7V91_00635 [bacterium 1xD42-67]|nr:hypothetical protein D7V91_00635 [bacterium 1xD42-67]
MPPVPDMDGRLYWAILRSQGRWADSIYDLKKIKVLKDLTQSIDPYYERPWGKLAPGDFSAIGYMEDLHTLIFDCRLRPDEGPLQVDDFSFLTRCKKLKKLDLHSTSFTDCSLLTELPALKQVYLPARKKLEHVEALDALSCEIKTDEPEFTDDTFPDYGYIPTGEILPPSGEAAVRYLSLDGTEHIDGGITQAVLDEMARAIRSGAAREVCLSMSEYGGEDDEDFLTVDIAYGWAVPAFNCWDEEGDAHLCLPVNERYSSVEEEAPVCIGGQSPVPKRFALDDLDLAAECVLYFARTGALYPGVPWARFD